jgi:DNA-binding response OmpR family regulator
MSSSILVVEDDLNMQELIVEFLEDEGYMAQGAGGSKDALSLASRFQFDLVITDVRMAGVDGVDGFVLLKKKLPNLKCIVITGYADRDAPARAIKIQIDDYIHKPFKLDELLAVVNRVLNANSLAAHYYNILEKAPAKLFSAALRFFKKDKSQALDNSRQRVFQGYYVAIRSNLIPANSANGVFSKLLVLDQQYKENLASPDDKTAQRLQGEYEKLFGFLTALARSKAQMLGGDRIPASEFRPVYNAVQKGDITPEQLQLAPTLRQVDPGELMSSPELLELRKKLWG